MKPITFPLPFFGLRIRIEANSAPSARIPAGKLSVPVLRSSPALPLSRRLLQDIGLDDSRKD